MREEFLVADDWHWILIQNGDLPKFVSDVEPLVRFLTTYYPDRAMQLTQNLQDIGLSFASALATEQEETAKLSREMMNHIHGKVYQIEEKQYNDSLGARWFATRWISLDIAMSGISALGTQQIGPLSLQAIALREPDAESITRRLDQLQDLSISIGNSRFSRAVDKFARNGKQELLDSLIKSDQHPDEFEDNDLQEKLLVSYARMQDWKQYRRTLAIRLIGTQAPRTDTENIVLRSQAQLGDPSAVLASLRKMQIAGIPVMPKTLMLLMSSFLRPRRRFKRPTTPRGENKKDDLSLVVIMLKEVMEAGSFVPASYWVEIIRRLGMTDGRWDELSDLLIFLASWYGPANRAETLDPATKQKLRRYQVPKCVPTWHHLHPLRVYSRAIHTA